MKNKKIIIIFVVFILLMTICISCFSQDKASVKNIKSEEELYRLATNYGYSKYDDIPAIFKILIAGPALMFYGIGSSYSVVSNSSQSVGLSDYSKSDAVVSNSSSRDYSTTNIQVENVDEADITKTDGYYIYSLSENDVIITDVNNPSDIKIASRIVPQYLEVPVDLILYKNSLIVIYDETSEDDEDYYWSYNNKNKTLVRAFDISDKSNPKVIKEFTLNNSYYTSRCIDGKLYVMASGRLKYNSSDKKVYHSYYEGSTEKVIDLDSIKYIDGEKSNCESIIAYYDLNTNSDIMVTDYLFDITNAYVSQNAIYLLDYAYSYSSDVGIIEFLKTIFSLKGIFAINDLDGSSSSSYKTKVFKFDIKNDGSLNFVANTKIEGKTLNQYSVDEKDGKLRIAVNVGWNKGAKIFVLDEKLKKIGETNTFGKNESLYSSRFIGDKAYVVTYRNTDPLFVIDLADVNNPKVLGKLKIPGYSTYLHPYDENHIIGIGIETGEVYNRDSNGRVVSSYVATKGMKMALFDVSDVNNPKVVSSTIIGDSRTTSAILTNPKALLFSKERNLICIPANRYNKDFEATTSSSYESEISSYRSYSKDYVAEGYLVYDISLEDGFKLKGSIEHPEKNRKVDNFIIYNGKLTINYSNSYSDKYYKKYNYTRLLRGLYIDSNLYTISEDAIFVNNLNDLYYVAALSLDK